MKNLRRESDFDSTEKDGDWFEQDINLLKNIEADKQSKAKFVGKARKRLDSEEEEKKTVEIPKGPQDDEKLDQTDM